MLNMRSSMTGELECIPECLRRNQSHQRTRKKMLLGKQNQELLGTFLQVLLKFPPRKKVQPEINVANPVIEEAEVDPSIGGEEADPDTDLVLGDEDQDRDLDVVSRVRGADTDTGVGVDTGLLDEVGAGEGEAEVGVVDEEAGPDLLKERIKVTIK